MSLWVSWRKRVAFCFVVHTVMDGLPFSNFIYVSRTLVVDDVEENTLSQNSALLISHFNLVSSDLYMLDIIP